MGKGRAGGKRLLAIGAVGLLLVAALSAAVHVLRGGGGAEEVPLVARPGLPAEATAGAPATLAAARRVQAVQAPPADGPPADDAGAGAPAVASAGDRAERAERTDPGRVLAGVAVLADGDPLVGIELVAVHVDSAASPPDLALRGGTTTDAQGAFRIEGLADGTYRFHQTSHPGLGPASPWATAGETDVVVTFEGYLLRLLVRRTDGAPAAGAEVLVRHELPGNHVARQQVADESGEVEFALSGPGLLKITATSGDQSVYGLERPLEGEPRRRDGVVDLRASRYASLRVEVVDTHGRPIPDFRVELHSDDGTVPKRGWHSEELEPGGWLRDVPPSRYTLALTERYTGPFHLYHAEAWRVLVLEPGAVEHARFEVPLGGRLEIVNRSDQDLPPWKAGGQRGISVRPAGDPDAWTRAKVTWRSDAGTTVSVRIPAGSTVFLKNTLPEGAWVLRLGGPEAPEHPFTITAGQTTRLELDADG